MEGRFLNPVGYSYAGIHAGLKKRKKDMALIVSDRMATSAAAFTTNVVKAAPVIYDMGILKGGKAQAILVNSGNANACTGTRGLEDAGHSAALIAHELDIPEDAVFVSSTGVIGVPLDMERIEGGIKELATSLGDDPIPAAEAILTTDTKTKLASVEVEIDGKSVTISGMAKGSGMIHPNMATMLCFIITDATIGHEALQKLLGKGICDSFNMISVDGDTSTNDSVIVLANGASGCGEIEEGSTAYAAFAAAFDQVLGELARQIVKDGEGASRFIEMRVTGASSKADARTLARAVISSSLVKAAFFGADANWGRILCAMGYSGASFNPDLVDLDFISAKGKIRVLEGGVPLPFDEDEAKAILLEKEVAVLADCHQGDGEAVAWGCDLTYDYVKINGDYRS
ncbi:MAG: bifunctional glutamate N-acetyltransferase/amino-acid acetyltransferase ArgJ [Spirochaetes bacterium]|uniref:Arginine biosynthesis bifunctional protein ArgJ n=1 Tax=Candidatus Aphodenecus pullistercoris TaxID=2840669 RepID=A0A9D9E911_9SPIR|nr:bifunctional glutamate N-acetyltransferase/amino-acid acetyltransferase ArgJ [Candidatus Aphodenecus pullistercoris]